MATTATYSRVGNPQQRAFLPVGNGTHFNGNGGADETALLQLRCRQTRKLLRVYAGGADVLRVEWANIWTSNTPDSGDPTASREIPGPQPVTARMSIEYPAGTPRIVNGSAAWDSATAYSAGDQVNHNGDSWVAETSSTGTTPADSSAAWRRVRRYPVHWADQDDADGTVTFAPGDYKISTDIPLAEKTIPGDKIAVLGAFDTGSDTGRLPYAGMAGAANHGPFVDWVADAPGGLPAAGSALPDTGVTDQTNANTTPADDGNVQNWMRIPYATAVTGNIPEQRCVALFGDSLVQGAGGDVLDGEPGGIFVRALPGSPRWRIAQGGNRADCYHPGNAPWQMSCVARCSATVTDMSINDIQAGNGAETVRTSMVRLWRELRRQGTPVWATLLSPISESSDGWATLANQTRWTAGGADAFPGDDASYLTSVYGQIAMWVSNQGAEIGLDGSNVQAGQNLHPLAGVLDVKALMADAESSWKWAPGYTTDGAHPVAVAAQVQAAYLVPQMTPVLVGERRLTQDMPAYLPQGESPVRSMERSFVNDQTGSNIGSVMSVVGVSPGRYYYGFRLCAGTNGGNRDWAILAGADPAKLRVVDSGTAESAPDTIMSVALAGGAGLWLPPGQLIVVIAGTGGVTGSWAGRLPPRGSALHVTGLGYILGGENQEMTSAPAVGDIHSIYGGAEFTAVRTRLWCEIY